MTDVAVQGRQAQKHATQARILDVARLHFEREGFERANLRAIASEAGVAAGTVLLHFTDKLGLLHAALHDDLEATIARCLATKSRGGLLARLVRRRGRSTRTTRRGRGSRRSSCKESLLAEPPWRERFTHQLTRVLTHVTVLVEEAKKSGELAQTTDGRVFAAAFSSFYYFALIGWVQGGLEEPMPLFKKLMAQHISVSGSES